MEGNFTRKQLDYLSAALKQVQNSEQTLEIKLPEGMPDVGQVLTAWGQPVMRSKEWLDSAVIYQQDEETITAFKAMVPMWFSPLRARWHYYSMAQKNFPGYLQGDEVRLKKYFYVLRPLLAVRWVEAGKGVPPMRFAELLAGSELDAPLRAEIDELLERKQRAGEAEYGPRRPLLHAFIRAEQARGEIPPLLPDSREGDVKELDSLMYQTVMRRA